MRAGGWMQASVLGEVDRGSRWRLSPYRLATYVYALMAYLLLAGCVLGGLALIVLTWPNPFTILVGVILIGIAYIARPRMPAAPALVGRAEFAAVYQMADDVADALGAHRVAGIAIDDRFNASFGRYGRRCRRIMTLGLPLLTVLEPQERVALVAHEIAHDVNRDPVRGLFVGNAFRILVDLYDFFLPQHLGIGLSYGPMTSGTAMLSVGGRFANVLLGGVAFLIRPFLRLFVLLMRRDSQRAEYLADGLAADVAGSEAARLALRKAHLSATYASLAKGAAVQGEQADLLGSLRRWVVDAPQSEWERIDRVMQLDKTQVSSTHPPTVERVRFLERRPPAVARVVMTTEQRDAIDRELMPLERAFARDHLDAARARLYRR